MGVLWITHDLGVVAKLCDRVVIMYAGEVMEQGDVYGVLKQPRHPYTRRLIDALPKLGRPEQRLMPIEGRPPDPANLPRGCSFAPRCYKVQRGVRGERGAARRDRRRPRRPLPLPGGDVSDAEPEAPGSRAI